MPLSLPPAATIPAPLAAGLAALFLSTAPAPAATLYTFTFDGFRHSTDDVSNLASGMAVFRIDEAAVDAAAASGPFVTVSPYTTHPPEWQDAIRLEQAEMRVETPAGALVRSYSYDRETDGTDRQDLTWFALGGNLTQIKTRLWEVNASSRIIGGFELGFSSEEVMNFHRRSFLRGTGSEDLRDGVAAEGLFSNVFGALVCEGSYAIHHDPDQPGLSHHFRFDNGTFERDTGTCSLESSGVTLTSGPAGGGGPGNQPRAVGVVPLPAAGGAVAGSSRRAGADGAPAGLIPGHGGLTA